MPPRWGTWMIEVLGIVQAIVLRLGSYRIWKAKAAEGLLVSLLCQCRFHSSV